MPPVNFRLFLVTDRHQTGGRSLLSVLRDAIHAGAPAIQLRERDLMTGDLLSLARDIQMIAASRSVPVLVNDRVDLVMALNLAGVHLRANSLPVALARRLLGPTRLVGVSTHSVDEVRRANEEGADYVLFGPVFDTPSKRSFGAPLGLEALAEACRQSIIPVFAIGGVTGARVCDIRRAGAYGVAVIGAVLTRGDAAAAIDELLDALMR